MFVLDDARCNENWEAVTTEVRGLLKKNHAEVFTFERWDERRLAYPIKGHVRGVYLLTRFTAPFDAIPTIERDSQLNETILRVLITRDLESEKLQKAGLLDPRAMATKPPAKPEAAAPPSPGQPPAAAPHDAPPATEPPATDEPQGDSAKG
jgi:ribosomal protein S6